MGEVTLHGLGRKLLSGPVSVSIRYGNLLLAATPGIIFKTDGKTWGDYFFVDGMR